MPQLIEVATTDELADGQAKLVGHTPEVIQPAAVRARPLDRLPLQRVVRAALQSRLG